MQYFRIICTFLMTVTCLYERKMYKRVWDLYSIHFIYLSVVDNIIGFWKEPDDGIDKPGI